MFELVTIGTSDPFVRPLANGTQVKTTSTRISPRRDGGRPPATGRPPRVALWAAAGVVTTGFLVALECAARHYGVRGPLANQAREVVFAPDSGPLLYAGLALTMVVLTWRQRLLAAGAAVGIDVVFWLVRWAVGADMNFGNGALWVVLGCAAVAVTRRRGSERTLLLKGAGLGLLLVAGHAPPARAVGGDVLAVDDHGPGGGADQPEHGAGESGLARARLADEADRLAGCDAQRDAVQGLSAPAPGAVVDVEPGDLQDGADAGIGAVVGAVGVRPAGGHDSSPGRPRNFSRPYCSCSLISSRV